MRTPVLDVFRPAVRALCRLYFGLELRGTEHIPATGPVLITPNHQTFADPPLVSLPVRRPVHYMAWSRLFDIPLFGRFIRWLRAFPVDIESADPRATREAVRLLQAGQAVMIFPEGERSLDGRVGHFKPGAFRLAVSLGVPVLPVTIAGAHGCWPPGRVLPRPGRVKITYHPLVRPDSGLEARAAARELAERAQATIRQALDGEPGLPSGPMGRLTMSKVRVNLANPQELLEIPGISPQQANAIVRHRVEHGPILDVAQLARILGGVTLSEAVRERLDFDPAEVTAPEAPGG